MQSNFLFCLAGLFFPPLRSAMGIVHQGTIHLGEIGKCYQCLAQWFLFFSKTCSLKIGESDRE